jgi:MYXO-CTERM domain-containing protein
MQCKADGDAGQTVTDPLDKDTDDGGATDGDEDADHDGVVDPGERNPTAGNGKDDGGLDTDGDGLSDGTEIDIGSDPKDADTDDDGIKDGDEPDLSSDSDGDGKINVLDPDSDNDGLFDGTEEGYGCDDAATDNTELHCKPDADMGKTTTNPIVADTDGGGVSDGKEDKNLDGAIEAGETDPKLACDDKGVLFCDDSLKSLTGGPAGCSVGVREQSSKQLASALGLLALAWLVRRRASRSGAKGG